MFSKNNLKELIDPSETEDTILQLREMRHPCLVDAIVDFTPNDTVFDSRTNAILVTGPNMGGKSTLLRQTCIAVLMAQIGSFIPARSLRLTPVDRIFTRLGATDDLLEGKSTFFIELEDTYNIVTQATKNSLVIMDELGRGTSTYDGMSIAFSVLKHLIERSKSKVLFATHYHMLIDLFRFYDGVDFYQMAY